MEIKRIEQLEKTRKSIIVFGITGSETAQALFEWVDEMGEVLEELEGLQKRVKQLETFKKYWSELYGEGLEVANWHQNGDTEPFDNFFDSAETEESNASM